MRLRGPITAVVWEQWRLVREAYLTAMATSVIYPIGVRFVVLIDPYLPWRNLYGPGYPRTHSSEMLLPAYFLLLLSVYSLVDPPEGGDDRSPCLTTRQWLLPMSRGGFVATYLLVRLGLLLSLAVPFGGTCSLLGLAKGNASGLPLCFLVASLGPALSLGFAADWLLIRASVGRRGRMFVVLSLLYLLFATALTGNAHSALPNAGWCAAGSLALSAVFVVPAIGIALSFDRLAWLNRLSFSFDRIEQLFRRRRSFRDRFMAQVWYEWRRHGLLGPGCYVAILTAVLVPITRWSWSESPHPVISPFLLGPSPNVANALSVLLLAVCGVGGCILLLERDRRKQSLYPRLMPGVPGMLTPISMVIAAQVVVLPTLALGACVLIGIATGWFRVEMLPVTLGDHTTLARAASVLATSCGLLALMVALFVAAWLVCMLIPCYAISLAGWAAVWLLLAYAFYWHRLPVAGDLLDLWTNVRVAVPACALLLFIAVGAPPLVFARKPLSRNVFSATAMLSCVLLAYWLLCELALLFNGLPPDQRPFSVGVASLVLLVLVALAIAIRTRRFPHPVVGLLLALLIGGAMILLRLTYPGPLGDLSVETVCGLPILCCLPMPAVLFHVRWVGTHWYDEPKEA